MDVDHDEMIEPLQRPDGPGRVGFGLGRVLADHEQCAEVTVLHRLEHLAEVAARRCGDLDAPFPLEPGPGGVVGDVLKPRQPVGQGAHVAAALDVVLAAQG